MIFDYTQYLHPQEYSSELKSGDDYVRKYYEQKAIIAAEINPKIIFEIGVRVGYSAAAFLFSNPTSFYIGLDSFLEGRFKDQVIYVKSMLNFKFPKASIKIIKKDSQKVATRGWVLNKWRNQVDLIHIDGNHSYEGCFTDLWLAYRLGKTGSYILVDDYLNPKFKNTVRVATDEFAKILNIEKKIFNTWRGDALLRIEK